MIISWHYRSFDQAGVNSSNSVDCMRTDNSQMRHSDLISESFNIIDQHKSIAKLPFWVILPRWYSYVRVILDLQGIFSLLPGGLSNTVSYAISQGSDQLTEQIDVIYNSHMSRQEAFKQCYSPFLHSFRLHNDCLSWMTPDDNLIIYQNSMIGERECCPNYRPCFIPSEFFNVH